MPLDNRSEYTKLDWIYWTAALAGSQKDFDALIDPTWKFANESPSRVPLTDWYWTQRRQAAGLPGPVGGGRLVHEDADGRFMVEEMGERAILIGKLLISKGKFVLQYYQLPHS